MGYSLTILCAKLSFFLLYLRIFSCSTRVRWAIYLGVAIVTGFYLATSIAYGYACIPRRSETWFSAGISDRCQLAKEIGFAQGIFGLISDLYLYFLPVPVILGLNLARKKKIGVLAIFGTGLM